jgi:hypothetical protein
MYRSRWLQRVSSGFGNRSVAACVCGRCAENYKSCCRDATRNPPTKPVSSAGNITIETSEELGSRCHGSDLLPYRQHVRPCVDPLPRAPHPETDIQYPTPRAHARHDALVAPFPARMQQMKSSSVSSQPATYFIVASTLSRPRRLTRCCGMLFVTYSMLCFCTTLPQTGT